MSAEPVDEDAVFHELMLIDANKRCFDCGKFKGFYT
jgi:hypothetical protein